MPVRDESLENLNQFKPGESGNPAGRPKGSRNMSTILKEFLEEEVEVIVDGSKIRMPYQEAIIRKLLKKANDGETKAIQEIFDRTEGKAKQEIKLDGLPEPNVTVTIAKPKDE